MYIPELSQRLYHGAGKDNVFSAGWLERGNDFPTGDCPKSFLDLLRNGPVIRLCRGFHVCDLCGQETGNGEYWVLAGDKVFVLPDMVTHYIVEHRYLPPKELTDHAEKVLSGPEANSYSRPLAPEEIKQLEKEHDERLQKIIGGFKGEIERVEDARAFTAIDASLLDVVSRDLEAKEKPL